jgi:hypothetical protein
MESKLDRKEVHKMERRWIEIGVVLAAMALAAVWTLNPAVAFLPAVFYMASKRERHCLGRTAG